MDTGTGVLSIGVEDAAPVSAGGAGTIGVLDVALPPEETGSVEVASTGAGGVLVATGGVSATGVDVVATPGVDEADVSIVEGVLDAA